MTHVLIDKLFNLLRLMTFFFFLAPQSTLTSFSDHFVVSVGAFMHIEGQARRDHSQHLWTRSMLRHLFVGVPGDFSTFASLSTHSSAQQLPDSPLRRSAPLQTLHQLIRHVVWCRGSPFAKWSCLSLCREGCSP